MVFIIRMIYVFSMKTFLLQWNTVEFFEEKLRPKVKGTDSPHLCEAEEDLLKGVPLVTQQQMETTIYV